MRPKQWIKNLFIFAAIIFVHDFFNIQKVLLSISGFIIFCFASSATYIINDIFDLQNDKQHPIKKNRPIASGKIPVFFGIILSIILICVAFLWALYLKKWFALIILMYFTLNILYSFKLKYVVIIDIIVIAIGFVLRAVSGAVIIDVFFSPWLVFCTFFLTLFLAISKRKNELEYSSKEGARIVLSQYSLNFLNQMNMIVLPLTLMTYTLYTFYSEHSRLLMLTVPIVLYGLFRYLFILDKKKLSDNGPTDDFYSDRCLQVIVIVWLCVVLFILLYGK